MKKIILSILLLFTFSILFACSSKVDTKSTNNQNSETVFKPGVYKASENGVLTYYYEFYENDNSGTFTDTEGISGLPFRFDVLEVNGNITKAMFHMADESDNTKATITKKNENEYTLELEYENSPATYELIFTNEKIDDLIKK